MNIIKGQNVTHEEAKQLIRYEKHIVEHDKKCDDVNLYLGFSKKKYSLKCEETSDTFMWQISQSQKARIRISLHVQEKESYTGLMRIDYNSNHKNPDDISPDVPPAFHAYAGKFINESHIHYHIDGYRPLAWAVPLRNDAFKVKTITEEYLNEELERSIHCFAQAINVITNITVQQNIL